MLPVTYKLEKTDGRARAGVIETPHGIIHTPVFMPVGTQGTLKGLTPEQLHQLNCRLILGNTYHLGHRQYIY